jgi:hypothetical protein
VEDERKKLGKRCCNVESFGMLLLRTSIVTLANVVWLANLGKRVWSSEVEYPQIAAAAVAHWLESLPASVKGTTS